jgi:hypothetical protein
VPIHIAHTCLETPSKLACRATVDGETDHANVHRGISEPSFNSSGPSIVAQELELNQSGFWTDTATDQAWRACEATELHQQPIWRGEESMIRGADPRARYSRAGLIRVGLRHGDATDNSHFQAYNIPPCRRRDSMLCPLLCPFGINSTLFEDVHRSHPPSSRPTNSLALS